MWYRGFGEVRKVSLAGAPVDFRIKFYGNGHPFPHGFSQTIGTIGRRPDWTTRWQNYVWFELVEKGKTQISHHSCFPTKYTMAVDIFLLVEKCMISLPVVFGYQPRGYCYLSFHRRFFQNDPSFWGEATHFLAAQVVHSHDSSCGKIWCHIHKPQGQNRWHGYQQVGVAS